MKKSKLGRTPGLDALTYVVLIAAALVALFPVLWGLFTALKSPAEVNSFLPHPAAQRIYSGKFLIRPLSFRLPPLSA